jgi:serine/threonine-protein phosphatase 6 regulatory ankyrin repeat subunit B
VDEAQCQEVRAAARSGLEALRAARARGVSLNARDEELGQTALMQAAGDGKAEAVGNLLALRAAVDLQDNDGWTAIMLAAHRGHTTVVAALIEAGAALDLQRSDGSTALAVAAEFGKLGAVEALIAAGADLNVPDTQGRTALQRARSRGKHEVVAALQRAGARVHARHRTYGAPLRRLTRRRRRPSPAADRRAGAFSVTIRERESEWSVYTTRRSVSGGNGAVESKATAACEERAAELRGNNTQTRARPCSCSPRRD